MTWPCANASPRKAPAYLDTDLTDDENTRVRHRIQRITTALKGRGIKVQHLAALFHHQPRLPQRSLILSSI
ncbi:MAG: hypothetical protein R2864_02735 [Syntrophotaleaceae bacterium]